MGSPSKFSALRSTGRPRKRGEAEGASLRPSMQPGQQVVIHSLKGRAELNGKVGRILSYDDAKGRYAVHVQDESFLLKGDNLMAAEQCDVP